MEPYDFGPLTFTKMALHSISDLSVQVGQIVGFSEDGCPKSTSGKAPFRRLFHDEDQLIHVVPSIVRHLTTEHSWTRRVPRQSSPTSLCHSHSDSRRHVEQRLWRHFAPQRQELPVAGATEHG